METPSTAPDQLSQSALLTPSSAVKTASCPVRPLYSVWKVTPDWGYFRAVTPASSYPGLTAVR